MSIIQEILSESRSIRTGKDVEILNHGTAEVITEYRCSCCGERYSTYEEALSCSQQPEDTCDLEIGSLVIIPNECAYYYNRTRFPSPAEDPWLAFSRPGDPHDADHFNHKTQYYQWFVVTALHYERRNRHRIVATVCSFMDGRFVWGWNPVDGVGHDSMFRPGIPKEQQRNCTEGTLWWEDTVAGVKFGDLVLSASPSPRLLQEATELADLGISTDVLL